MRVHHKSVVTSSIRALRGPSASFLGLRSINLAPRSMTTRCRTQWLNLNERLVTSRHMEELKAAGIQVLAYTVNDLARARQLQSLGVRGIFTDRPDLMVPAFRPSAPAGPAPDAG